MTHEEKYQLVVNYINQLIERKKSVRSHGMYNNLDDFCFGFDELMDGGSDYITLRVSLMSLSILHLDGSKMIIGLFQPQKTEIKYLFNKLVEISEENCIKYLQTSK